MVRLSSLPFGSTHPWFALVLGTVLLASCASTPDFSALEDDELYLRRGEEFVTDAAYLAFAYENNAEEAAGDDYYDPARGTDFGPGYMNSYGMPGYQPSYYNRYRPFGGGFGSGFGTQWGLSSYMNPYAAGGLGMGYGYGMGGYDPFYSGWGNPYSMGYGSGFGYGNPYAWNNGWGSSWNNPYGYTNWGNNTINYGGWTGTGSNDSFTSLTGRTRTPIMSYTGSGSNYDQEGVLVRPKVEVQRPDEVPAAAPARTEEAPPTYVSPRESRRARGWMQPDNSTRQSSPTRSWSSPSPSNNSNNSFNNSSRSRSNSFSAPSNSSGGSRSNGSSGSSSGNSRSSSSSRSSRGGGR